MKEKTKPAKNFQTKRSERISFGVFGIGGNIFFVIVGYYLQQYYLVNVGVPAAILGTVFLVVKIWDAVNDPMFGIIVDKARLKSGKYLPWMRVATFTLPVTATALFFVPLNISITGKAIFLLVCYALYDVSSTLTEVPYFAITTAMTDNPTERSQIISSSKLISMLPAVSILFIPTLYNSIGWKPTIAIFAVLALLVMLPGCYVIKERYDVRPETPPKIKEIFRYLAHNKYLLIFFLSAILYGLTNTAGSVSNLFAIYNLGSDSWIAPLLLISFVPSLLSILVVKFLLNHFDKIHILIASNLVTVATSVLLYVTGYHNFPLFAAFTVVRGFSAGVNTMMYFLFTPDFAEYGTYVTGTHGEGIAFSIQSFSSKVIGALAGTVSLYLLGAFGFESGAKNQTAGAMTGIWLLLSVIPAIGAVAQILTLALLYRLRDRDVAIMSKANHGEMTAGEAQERLGGKYAVSFAAEGRREG